MLCFPSEVILDGCSDEGSGPSVGLLSLPGDVLKGIFSHLDIADLGCLRLAGRELEQVIAIGCFEVFYAVF
jgi:hypothetical protein